MILFGLCQFLIIFLNFRENNEKLVQGVYIWGSDEFKRLFLPALAFDRVSFGSAKRETSRFVSLGSHHNITIL